jgi:hypothetical protein
MGLIRFLFLLVLIFDPGPRDSVKYRVLRLNVTAQHLTPSANRTGGLASKRSSQRTVKAHGPHCYSASI